MRFTARALGALTTAGILAVTHPGAVAYAAEGYLILGKRRIENFSGTCFPYRSGSLIKNRTTGVVTVFLNSTCGGPTAALSPGSIARVAGRSVRVL